MKTLVPVAATVLLLTAGNRAQAGITGKWQGETGNGATLVLDVTVKGTELKGTFTRNGQGGPIADGKVSKNSITFKATLNEQAEGFTGEVEGDQMRIWLDRQGASRAIVLKRVKA